MVSTGKKRVRVLIADDHDIVRQGLRRVLEMDESIEVVGEARNGTEAVSRAIALTPDVIVMDLKMPEMDGITATREIKQRVPNVSILVLTMFADNFVQEAIEAGVSGYLLKDGDASKITKAVAQLQEGESPISPALNRTLVTEYVKLQRQKPSPLTDRQLDILKLTCQGVNAVGICDRLSISLSTQKREMRNIFTALGVNCAAHAVSVALKQGLIKDDVV